MKRPTSAKPRTVPTPKAEPALNIGDMTLARARQKRSKAASVNPFAMPQFPPGVAPKAGTLAQDSALCANSAWAGDVFGSIFAEGQGFLGYAYLAELAQRPEFRVISETIATEMTRKWIRIQAKSDDEDKTDKIKQIEDAFERLRVRDVFRDVAQQDGFFGRGHIYVDLGTTDDPNELKTPIGDGWNAISRAKVGKGDLQRLSAVEAVWCYPTNYNSSDPLRPDWYKPSQWFVMGKEVHSSRLLTFIGREVPDLLKPAYSFGGLSLSQMAKPYVDNWLKTRQSVADIVSAFSVFVLATDISETLTKNGDQLFKRADLFNSVRDNRGLMMINKETEEFENVAAPLSTLDALQAQTQEHMAAVSRIPLVKLLGIQPAGLNASSEGEIRTFYDTIHAYQQHFFAQNLHRVLGLVQLSEFGEVDPDITFAFEPLWSLDEKGEAEVRKIEAETDQILIDTGIIAPAEARQRVAGDGDTPYQGLDVDDVPDLAAEEADGLDPGKGQSSKEGDDEEDESGKDERTKLAADAVPPEPEIDADRMAQDISDRVTSSIAEMAARKEVAVGAEVLPAALVVVADAMQKLSAPREIVYNEDGRPIGSKAKVDA